MKAVILDGNAKNDLIAAGVIDVLIDELKEANVEIETKYLDELEIASCIGCFGCWSKTPGICVINDAGRDIAKQVIRSNLVIFLTPLTFGGYSSVLKKAIDRLTPLISPFYTKIDGEVHHKPRYKQYPSLVGLGITLEQDEESKMLFENLVSRNAINFHSPAYASDLIVRNQSPEQMRQQIKKLLVKVGVTV